MYSTVSVSLCFFFFNIVIYVLLYIVVSLVDFITYCAS